MSAGNRATAIAAAGLLWLGCAAGTAAAGTWPNIMQACVQCHQGVDGKIRGKMVSASEQFKSFNVTVG